VADLDILRRDLAVYLTTIIRILNAPLHPFDYAATAGEIRGVVKQYQDAAGGEVDFSPILEDLEQLRQELHDWRAEAESRVRAGEATERRRLNAVLRQIARLLVPLNYARGERFDHDPALKFGAVPRLEAAAGLPALNREMKPFVRVGLIREINKVRAVLRAARRELKVSLESRVLL
jgi:hypothetical protein